MLFKTICTISFTYCLQKETVKKFERSFHYYLDHSKGELQKKNSNVTVKYKLGKIELVLCYSRDHLDFLQSILTPSRSLLLVPYFTSKKLVEMRKSIIVKYAWECDESFRIVSTDGGSNSEGGGKKKKKGLEED